MSKGARKQDEQKVEGGSFPRLPITLPSLRWGSNSGPPLSLNPQHPTLLIYQKLLRDRPIIMGYNYGIQTKTETLQMCRLGIQLCFCHLLHKHKVLSSVPGTKKNITKVCYMIEKTEQAEDCMQSCPFLENVHTEKQQKMCCSEKQYGNTSK